MNLFLETEVLVQQYNMMMIKELMLLESYLTFRQVLWLLVMLTKAQELNQFSVRMT